MSVNISDKPRVGDLSSAKRALLEKRLRGGFKSAAAEQAIPRRATSAPAPLSFSQERLWILNQIEPGTDAYIVPIGLELTGVIEPARLEGALNEILRRHEVMRATFPAPDATPVQMVSPFNPRPLPIEDLRATPTVEREELCRRRIAHEVRQPFDLAVGPLVRWRLLQIAEDRSVLLVTMHHIISDGWSIGVFCRELQAAYNSVPQHDGAVLGELPIQYGDFSAWQREQMRGTVLLEHLDYWKRQLAGAPPALKFPQEPGLPPRPAVSTAPQAGREHIVLDKELSGTLSRFSKEGASPFITMLTALGIAIGKWTQQTDLVIGAVVAGRTRREIENLIGCFMNFLPLRLKLGQSTLGQTLEHVKATVLEAYAHQDCPFEKIVEAVNPARGAGRNPIYNVAFLMQNFPRGELQAGSLSGKYLRLESQTALLDLRFLAEETDEGLVVTCEYDRALFHSATIHKVLDGFHDTLAALLRSPEKALADVQFDSGLVRAPGPQAERIAIAATFTAEPLSEPLRFWMRTLDLPVEIEFAPYNQVFQQLLDPASLLAANPRGMNLLLLRLEDFQRFQSGSESAAPGTGNGELQSQLAQMVTALKTALAHSKAPWLICVCPASPRSLANASLKAKFACMEETLAAELSGLSGVHLVLPSELAARYPVADYDDPHGDELGHVPYTPLFFASLATLISRKFHALKRPPKKVIVLDCDQTLWAGVCGEDGPRGIKVDEARQALQRFMLAQREAGMLLCVCSKNNEADVQAVFDSCSDMPLRPEHFAAMRINWRPKSENLRSLAEELKLSPDSFILVDDNPVECAEAQANCPGLLALQLPEDARVIPQFLEHAWVFDHLNLTDEDRRRAALYQENRQREALQSQALSLADFLAGLNLEVNIERANPEQLARVAQLTQRTNQFNVTTRRRTEAEVGQLWRGTEYEILTASVKDRFGDYGLVGVLVFSSANAAIVVDTFLLSCRVLGKGVEHRMLARLGEIAKSKNLTVVHVPFIPSDRNKPARDFLEDVGGDFREEADGMIHFRFPAEFAADTSFKPAAAVPVRAGDSPVPQPQATREQTLQADCRQLGWISLNLREPAQVLRALDAQAVVKPGSSKEYVAPRTELERQLCEKCRQLLRVERVGIRDNFFGLGGSSLMAVQLLAELRKITGRNVALSALLQAPTLEQLADLLQDARPPASALVPLQPKGTRPPLILVHGAGGGILWGYSNLAAHLNPDQPVYAIEPQAGTPESAGVEELASRYVGEVRGLQPAGPYYLGGYCFGAYVAYEMARELIAKGEKVGLVLLIDAAAPNGNYDKVNWQRWGFLPDFTRNLFYWLHDFFALDFRAQGEFFFRQLGVFRRKLLGRLRDRNNKPIYLEQYVNTASVPEHELEFWRHHLRAGAEYVPKPYSGRITLVRTRSQPLFCSYDPAYGWGELAAQGVDIRIIPGSHENIFKEPDVRSLAQTLETCLATAQKPV
jgi:FkbH-like protein